MARRGDLFTSQDELRTEALRRVKARGRANLSEAALILKWAQPRVRAYCDRGEIEAVPMNGIRYIPVEELERILEHPLR
jgi:hypothetical protein